MKPPQCTDCEGYQLKWCPEAGGAYVCTECGLVGITEPTNEENACYQSFDYDCYRKRNVYNPGNHMMKFTGDLVKDAVISRREERMILSTFKRDYDIFVTKIFGSIDRNTGKKRNNFIAYRVWLRCHLHEKFGFDEEALDSFGLKPLKTRSRRQYHMDLYRLLSSTV